MLTFDEKWKFTYDEIVDVVVARATQMQAGQIVCMCCGRQQMALSRDTGISKKWWEAAMVLGRLQRGDTINGGLD